MKFGKQLGRAGRGQCEINVGNAGRGAFGHRNTDGIGLHT